MCKRHSIYYFQTRFPTSCYEEFPLAKSIPRIQITVVKSRVNHNAIILGAQKEKFDEVYLSLQHFFTEHLS